MNIVTFEPFMHDQNETVAQASSILEEARKGFINKEITRAQFKEICNDVLEIEHTIQVDLNSLRNIIAQILDSPDVTI